MTPVAPLVAMTATTWDAALAETLSRGADPRSPLGVPGVVHSVHRRVVNVLFGDLLVALADERLDDAPWTVRLPSADWPRLIVSAGDGASMTRSEVRIDSREGGTVIRLDGAGCWRPLSADLASTGRSMLVDAHAALAPFRSQTPQTAFGRASAALLGESVSRLRDVSAAMLGGTSDARAVEDAILRLMGLGEGLTPSGDDILCGLAFLAAQTSSGLEALLPPLRRSLDTGAGRTTLLSAVTIGAATAGRGRQSMHDLALALQAGDIDALKDAAARILAIGHSSGADILTGMRLALELAAGAAARPSLSQLNPKKENNR